MAGKGKRGPDLKPRRKRAVKPSLPPGPGRPPGISEALPRNARDAIVGLRHRVPLGTPEPLGELADLAFQTVVDVMRGKFHKGGVQRLGAAKTVREEICGSTVQKHEHTGAGGGPISMQVEDARERVRAKLFKPEENA